MSESRNYCCYYASTLRSVMGVVAVIDLLIVAIPLAFESASIGYFLGILDPIERDKCTTFSITRKGLNIVNCTSNSQDDNSVNPTQDELPSKDKDSIYQMSNKFYNSQSVLLLIGFILMGAVIEGYLFSVLQRGVREKIYYCCRNWFWIRLILLFFIILTSLGKILTNNYNIYVDGIFDLLKVYRIMGLIIMRMYMKELENTVGMIYLKPPSSPKKGSLGQDIHLLN